MEGDTRGRQGIQVNLTVRRSYRKGYRKMWVFGYRSRSRDYFPDQPAGTVFPVWVKVERMNENENENEKE